MICLEQALKNGLNQPFRFISQEEAIRDACQAVGELSYPLF